jgi:hypothetical protein
MDKPTAIQQAVWAQLSEHYTPPQTGNEVFSQAPYGFGRAQMLAFLQGVALRLQPNFVFAYQNVSVDESLGWTVNYFCQAILDEVNPAPAD